MVVFTKKEVSSVKKIYLTKIEKFPNVPLPTTEMRLQGEMAQTRG